jgi:RNase P subunit RPR2
MVVGGIFWIMFSVVYGIIGGFSGRVPPEGMALVYLFGSMFLFSLPAAVFIEIVNWVRRRGKTEVDVRAEAMPTIRLHKTQQIYYCTKCGKPLGYNWQLQRWYCESCDIHAPTREELLRSAMTALEQGDKELAKKFMEQARSISESIGATPPQRPFWETLICPKCQGRMEKGIIYLGGFRKDRPLFGYAVSWPQAVQCQICGFMQQYG